MRHDQIGREHKHTRFGCPVVSNRSLVIMITSDQNGDERPRILFDTQNPAHSNIEVFDLERVVLDVFAPGLDLLAHEE
jgi:hypothetical protein